MKKNKILKIVSSIVFLTAVVVLANTYSKRNEENIYLNNGIDETGRVENSVDEKEQEAIENEEIKYIKELMAYKIEGLIILSHSISSHQLKEFNIPIVAIEREDNYISSVNSDNYSGAEKASKLLIKNKCDILIHINGKINDNTPAYKRIEAFKETCERNNQAFKIYMSDIKSSFEESYNSLYQIYLDIDKNYPYVKKGVFLSNDTHANIFLNILIRNKKSIPDEYELIGFDNSPISTEAIIPITTIGQNIDKISDYAIKSLLRQINLKKNNKIAPIEHIVVPTELIVRDTTSKY